MTKGEHVLRTESRRRGRPAGVATVVGLAALLVGLFLAAFDSPGLAQEAPKPVVGQTVVSEYRTGKVELLDADGKVVGTIASGLNVPRGVLALRDGSVIIAEYGAGRLVGTGGRFGPGLAEIAKLTTPEGLGYGLDGSVYATSLNDGTVVKVDLDSGALTTVASGLKAPGDVVVRAGVLYVPEGTGGDVVAIQADGSTSVLATGFSQPLGIALGPGKTFFVSDYATGKISRVGEDGTVSDFAALDKPIQLAVEPFSPRAEEDFVLSVAAEAGVVRLDKTGAKLGTATVPLPVGVSAVPGGGEATTSTTTTTPGEPPTTAAGGTPGSTSRRTRSGTTVPPASVDEGTGAGTYLLIALLVVLGIAGVVAAWLKFGPKRGSAEAGFEEQPLDIVTVTEAFGPCAGEEVALAEAEGAVRSLGQQREAADRREAHARDAVDVATAGRDEALAAVAAAEQARLDAVAAGELESPERRPVGLDDLGLHTDEGRVVFEAFGRGEIDAEALELRWSEIGEEQAVAVFRAEDERLARSNPDGPWPEEVAAQAALADAEEALAHAERDLAEAHADIERFVEREAEAAARVAEAEQRLADCQAAHAAERREAAKAAVRAELVPGASPGPPASDPASTPDESGDESGDEATPSAVADADAESDADADAESETDAESESDADADAESDTDAESDADVAVEADAAVDTDAATDADADDGAEAPGVTTTEGAGDPAAVDPASVDEVEVDELAVDEAAATVDPTSPAPAPTTGMFTEAERLATFFGTTPPSSADTTSDSEDGAEERSSEPSADTPSSSEDGAEDEVSSDPAADADEVARLVAEARAAGRVETPRTRPVEPAAETEDEPAPLPLFSPEPEPPSRARRRQGRGSRDDGPDDLTDELFKF